MKQTKFTEGTRVQQARSFLKGLGVHPTDGLWRLQGTVTGTKTVGDKLLIRVLWGGEAIPKSSFPQYLSIVGKPESM